MSKIKAFYGKQLSTSAYVLEMALREKGMNFVPYVNCLTTEVFTRICHAHTFGEWIVPYPQGQQSLLMGMDNMGLHNAFESVELTSKTYEELLLHIKEWAKRGSFILGPLDPTPIWDRIETRYCKGFSRFIFVLKYAPDNTFIVHDPEGCPYFHIGAHKIFQALKNSNNTYSMFRLNSLIGLYSEEESYENIILSGIKNRRETLGLPEHICKGLKQLTVILSNRKLKSSEVATLIFAASETGIALIYIIEFLSNPPKSAKKKNYLNEITISKIIDILHAYKKTIAKLLVNLKQTSNSDVASSLADIVGFEQRLDDYFLLLLN